MIPLRPNPVDPEQLRLAFSRGKSKPRGVVWFGLTSFWGHLRHLLASGIATEDVDSRDWMTPDDPNELGARLARHLGAPVFKDSIVDSLGRDLWIDYIADTGDDVEVSAAVARLLFAEYELPDPELPGSFITAPRGDMLLFGGDTAYPVATVDEVNNRVLVPFNRVLAPLADNLPRALLGIPGNHDWYDGLDGFARMFRRRFEDRGQTERPSLIPVVREPLELAADWAKQFIVGEKVQKLKTLVLDGYSVFQSASYFILPLTSKIHLFGVDRQLKNVDYRQRHFFRRWQERHRQIVPWLVAPDPVYGFLEPRQTGINVVEALNLPYADRPSFVLTGDIHHYQRFFCGKTLNVIAGGGGAFLHPTPVHSTPVATNDLHEIGAQPFAATDVRLLSQWPTAKQSKALLSNVPFKVARGLSGFIPHLVLLPLFLPAIVFLPWGKGAPYFTLGPSFGLATLLLAPLLALLGGVRHGPKKIALLATLASALIVALPALQVQLLSHVFPSVSLAVQLVYLLVTLGLGLFLGAFIFGLYLALLTRFGWENTQAFTALDHPGFKHFLRLRVRADGKHIDGFCIGLTDPLAADARPELVDCFTWRA